MTKLLSILFKMIPKQKEERVTRCQVSYEARPKLPWGIWQDRLIISLINGGINFQKAHYRTSTMTQDPRKKWENINTKTEFHQGKKKTFFPMLSVYKIPYYVNQFLRRRVCFMRNQFKTVGRFSIKCVFPPFSVKIRFLAVGQNKTKKKQLGKKRDI